MPGAAAAGGVRAWSVFGTIGVRGLSGTISQLVGFNRAGKATAAVARTITGTFRTLAKVAGLVTLAVGGLAVASVKSFADFDSAMTQSLSIMTDVTEAMRKDMVQAARRVGRQTQFSSTQAAESYFFLASAGLDAKQSIAALPAVADFAQAGMFDLSRATELATDAQSALGLTSEDAQENLKGLRRVTDVLVKANTLANASVSQFADALTNKLAGRMRATNVSLEEGVALLAALADQGIKGKRAGQQLTIVLRDLPKAALKNEEAFKDLGVTVFDANGELRPMADIIGDLERELGGMSTKARIAALDTLDLNKRAADALNILLGTSEATQDWKEQLEEAAGTAGDVADKQFSSLTNSFGQLKESITQALQTLGQEFAPTFRGISQEITDWINRQDFQKLADDILTATEMIVTGLVRGIGQIGGVLTTMVTNAMSLGRALRDNPIGQFLGLDQSDRGRMDELRQEIENVDNLIRDVQQGVSQANLGPRLAALGLPPDADVEGLVRFRRALVFELEQLEKSVEESEQKIQRIRGFFSDLSNFSLELPRGVGAGAGAIGGGGGEAQEEAERQARSLPPVELPFQAKVEVPDATIPALQRDLEEGAGEAAGEAESGFASEGKRLGRSLIQGIISGSFSLEDFLKKALSTIVMSALFGPGGIVGLLGIGSPAKATVPIGEALVGGVIKGLHRRTPMLRTAMNRAFSARRTFHSGIRLAGAGGSGALNRAQSTSSFTPDREPFIRFDFSKFPEARTPMGRERDRQWQQWLRNQSQMAMEEGFRFEPR